MLRFRMSAQWGVHHDDATGEPSPLVYPFVAQWTDAGTCLIVDRRLPANRLVEVSRDKEVVWSLSAPPRMNFAHRLNDDIVLYAQGTALNHVNRAGEIVSTVRLPATRAFNCGSVLGDRLALAGDDGIFLLTVDGRELAHLRPREDSFIEPADVQLLASGNILVVDALTCCVVEIDPTGRRVRTFGRWREPGLTGDHLGGPYSACRLRDGRTIVADWRAHRLVEYDEAGARRRTLPGTGRATPAGPSFVRELPDGDLLVAETTNRRVLVRTTEGEVRWEYGAADLPRRTLSFPRTAQSVDEGLLVCDTYANRVVVLDERGGERWVSGPGGDNHALGLSLPRSAHRDDRGDVTIADGLNGRVVVVDAAGHQRREVTKVRTAAGEVALVDPHHAELTPSGDLLVVDSDLARVFIVNAEDRVVADWGGADGEQLADPHQAWLTPDGGVVVADSGNDRVVELAPDGGVVRAVTTTVDAPGRPARSLLYPRFGQPMTTSGRTLVVDTDACRVVAVAADGALAWQVGPLLDTSGLPLATPELRVPKWACFDRRNRLVVVDYYNSRIVAFRMD